jgi:hypothetical protein
MNVRPSNARSIHGRSEDVACPLIHPAKRRRFGVPRSGERFCCVARRFERRRQQKRMKMKKKIKGLKKNKKSVIQISKNKN